METTYTIGIDIGGTNPVVGVVATNGTILAREKFPTRSCGANFTCFTDKIERYIYALTQQYNLAGKIDGIGIGAPNGNHGNGTIAFASNLPWKEPFPIVRLLQERTHLPVALINDAKAAAIGERTYGAARGMRDFIIITLGTGVGSGIVANGELIFGHDGLAGELGHFIIRRGGRPCGCGRCGCLETYCSARGMARTAIELLQESTEDSPLRHIKEEEITSKTVYDAAEAGDPIAQKVFEMTGEILGESLADFMTFSSPEAIILFGGVTAAGERLLQPIRKALNKNLLCVYQTPQLLLSQLPTDDAAILGAAAVGVEAALRASGQSKDAMAS